MPCRPFCVSSHPPSAFILFLQMCEATYLAIFTFEMTVKIIAYGFAVGDDAYLKDAWCQLDFAVVTLAWLPILIPGFGNFSGAQLTLRNLRARECAQPAPRTRRLHRERAACTENAQHREPTRTGETRRGRWDHQPIFALTLPSSPCLPAVLALARVSLLQSSERFGRCGRCER